MDLLNEIEANLRLAENRIVALWGMGCVGSELSRQIIDSKLPVRLECVDKYNENYSDIDLLKKGKSKYFVVVTFVRGYEDAAKKLVDMGYEKPAKRRAKSLLICTYHSHIFQHALIISSIYELEPQCFFVEFSQFVIIFAFDHHDSAADCLLGVYYVLHGQ